MSIEDRETSGYVYVLSNPSMPGIVKVGRSIHGGKLRARQLFQGVTGVPTPFVVEFEMLVREPGVVEVLAHEGLQDFRVSESREFFRCDTQLAETAVIEAHLSLSDRTITDFESLNAADDIVALGRKCGSDLWVDSLNAVSFLRPEHFKEAIVDYRSHLKTMAEREREVRGVVVPFGGAA